MLKERDAEIHILKGKELEEEMKRVAEVQQVDLSLADLNKTRQILSSLTTSLSDDIVNSRENID